MYFRPTGPLTMGGVLAASWRLYYLSFRHCALLALLAAMQSALLAAWLLQPIGALTALWSEATLNMDLRALHTSGIQFARMTGGPVVASALVSTLLLAAMMVAPLALAAGAPVPGTIRALGFALRRVPWIVLGYALTLLLIGSGLVLLLLPGLYCWGRVQLWLVPVLAEDASATGAIGRSWRLTRGHWWRVSTLLSVALALLWLGSVFGAWIGAELGALAAPLLPAAAAPAWILASLIGNASRVFTLPFLAAMLVVIYDDLEVHALLARPDTAPQ
jgi:hypothetical protein